MSFVSLYTGLGTVTHFWEFYNSGTPVTPFSTTTTINPTYSFKPTGGTTVLVRHTVKITLPNGQVQTKFCEKSINLTCINPCNYFFHYDISGCSISINYAPAGPNPTVWDFGDGTPPVINPATLPSHTYTTSGTFIVSVSFNGKLCSLPVTIDCGENPCCNAEFTANAYRDCAILRLSLDPICAIGTHHWDVNPVPAVQCGFQLINFQPTAGSQNFQITNINTNIVTAIQITHTITCTNGQLLTQITTIPTPPDGIYIGLSDSLSGLSDWNCVLPGNEFTGPTPVVYITGQVGINKTFKFINADIQFDQGNSGLNMNNQLDFVLNNCFLHNASDCNCLWRGLKVGSKGWLTITNDSEIEDALYGIWISQPTAPLVKIDDTEFNKDFIGIRIDGNSGLFAFNTFNKNSFNGVGTLKNICTLSSYLDAVKTTPAPNIGALLPSVAYSTGQGFAGIYLNKIRLNLLTLADGMKNAFSGLAYGIIAHDSKLKIVGNSRFSNIAGTSYPPSQTAGIALFDASGISNLICTGSLPNSSIADFSNCTLGIYVRSQQGMLPTDIGITNTWIRNSRTGIYLDARYGNGAFRGTSSTANFSGISSNMITTTIQGIDLPAVAGINLTDWGTTQSNVEIYENTVTCANSVGAQPFASGISAFGAYPFNDIPALTEVDIHNNTVDVVSPGEIGINFSAMPNGTIRNNTGVTLGSGTDWVSGIKTLGGRRANVLCNTVTRSTGGLYTGSLYEFNSDLDGDYIGNHATGLGAGIRFEGDCTGANFRCNEMRDNQVGLFYTGSANGAIPAITGPQGTASVTAGNLWTSTVTPLILPYFVNGGAVNQGLFLASRYFFRTNALNETPLRFISPSSGWFLPADATATIDCVIPCPAPPQFMKPGVVNSLDNTIASSQMDFSGYPYSDEQVWRSEFSLYRKLLDHPELLQSSSLMQLFYTAKSGGNIGALWQAQIAIRTALTPPASTVAAVANSSAILEVISQQIAGTDAAIANTNNVGQLIVLQNQRAQQDSLLQIQQVIYAALSDQWLLSCNTAIPSLLNQINAITPENNSATSLKLLLAVYLQVFIQGQSMSTEQSTLLQDIAEYCLAQHGPAVLTARMLCQKKGLNPEDCFGGEERSSKNNFSPNISVIGAVIYPNPNNGDFMLKLPTYFNGKDVAVSVINTLGVTVFNLSSNGKTEINLHLPSLPNGFYRVYLNSLEGFSEDRAIIIQH